MPRSGEEARWRLQEAALELFREYGYDQTTTAEIAARAGVTERTFFRHFPDKKEVLFEGQTKLPVLLSDAIARAPEPLPPMEALCWAFQSIAGLIEEKRSFSIPRQQVIASTPALQERELAKAAAVTDALAAALCRRGVDDQLANLAAQIGMAAFRYAIASWFIDPSLRLSAYLDRTFDQLYDLSSALAATKRQPIF